MAIVGVDLLYKITCQRTLGHLLLTLDELEKHFYQVL